MDKFEDVMEVEEAPEVLGLDDFFTSSEDEKEYKKDSKSESSASVVKEPIPEDEDDHFTVSSKFIKDALNISAILSSSGEDSFESKMIAFSVHDGKVYVHMSDNKREVEMCTDLLNTEHQYTGFCAFGSGVIKKLTSLIGSYFTIVFRKEKSGDIELLKPKMLVHGGEISLDKIKVEESKYGKFSDDGNFKNYSSSDILDVLKRLNTFASMSIKNLRAIDFEGTLVKANNLAGTASIEMDTELPKCKLPLTDAKLLMGLISCSESDTVDITSDGKEYKSGDFKFRTEVYKSSEGVADKVASRMFEVPDSVSISLSHFKKVADISYSLDASSGYLGLNFKDGCLESTIITKRDNSTIMIDSVQSDVDSIGDDIEVSSQGLKTALTVFTSEEDADVQLCSDGIALSNGGIKVAVFSKSAGK